MNSKIVDESIILHDFVIEKTFMTPEGYYGVCVYNGIGHRCGYAGVPEDHPLYGEDYESNDVYSIKTHGVITYTGHLHRSSEILECEGYWFFGFDCGHLGDGRDTQAATKYGMEIPSGTHPAGTVRTLEYVVDQVLKLSAQLTPQAIMQSKMEGPDE